MTPKVSLKFTALGVFVFILLACSEPPPPTDKLIVGKSLPDIQLVDFDGDHASLADHNGKLIVLNLWATWCEPCRREMPALQALSDSLDDNRFVVLGISVDDDVHNAREFLIDKDVRFTSYFDEGGAVANAELGIPLYPYTLLISPEGQLIQRVPGAREWHHDDVVEILERAYHGDYSDLFSK